MKKLRLDLEELAVESFDTDRADEQKGTVEAHAKYTVYCQTDELGCSGWDSCGYTWCSCEMTCNQIDCY